MLNSSTKSLGQVEENNKDKVAALLAANRKYEICKLHGGPRWEPTRANKKTRLWKKKAQVDEAPQRKPINLTILVLDKSSGHLFLVD